MAGSVHRGSGSRRQRILLEPMTSTETSDLMASERDPVGNMLCLVSREVIRDPRSPPFMGDQRVHE
jgi:hypothetical protein